MATHTESGSGSGTSTTQAIVWTVVGVAALAVVAYLLGVF